MTWQALSVRPEWTAQRDNRANTIQTLKDMRKQVVCHERQAGGSLRSNTQPTLTPPFLLTAAV